MPEKTKPRTPEEAMRWLRSRKKKEPTPHEQSYLSDKLDEIDKREKTAKENRGLKELWKAIGMQAELQKKMEEAMEILAEREPDPEKQFVRNFTKELKNKLIEIRDIQELINSRKAEDVEYGVKRLLSDKFNELYQLFQDIQDDKAKRIQWREDRIKENLPES